MINSTNSFATAQSNSNCLNFPSRLVAWLYGKLVSIANAGKRIFSGKSQPDLTPIAERMFSKAKAQGTFFNKPTPRETTSSRKMELFNPANSPLPEIEGVELRRLSWDLRPIVGGMKQLLEVINNQNLHELKSGGIRGQSIENLVTQGKFDDEIFKGFAQELNVSQDIIDKCLKMDTHEKIIWLNSINEEQSQTSLTCCKIAGQTLNDIDNYLFPLIHNFITTLSEKHSSHSSEMASEKDIREFQKGLINLNKVLNKLTDSPVGDQIARDTNLRTMFSDIRNKLQNLAQSLQIS